MVKTPSPKAIERERFEVLRQLEDWLEVPLLLLGFAWLALLVIDFIYGLTPALETASTIIWVLFIADFFVKLILAPRKLSYLRSNWLTALALLVPALRVLRIARLLRLARAARAARSLRLFRMLTSLNRGMRALRASLRRRGVAYVTLLTLIVAFVGAAGMFGVTAPRQHAEIRNDPTDQVLSVTGCPGPPPAHPVPAQVWTRSIPRRSRRS